MVRREGTVVDAHRGVLRLLHEAGGVLHAERDARVALRLGEVREELAREAEYHLVDLHPHDLPQVGVLEQLSDGAAVAAADDEHTPRVGQVVERGVHQGLVVVALVALGDHQRAVDDQDLPEEVALVRLHELVRALLGLEERAHPVDGVRVGDLCELGVRRYRRPRAETVALDAHGALGTAERAVIVDVGAPRRRRERHHPGEQSQRASLPAELHDSVLAVDAAAHHRPSPPPSAFGALCWPGGSQQTNTEIS